MNTESDRKMKHDTLLEVLAGGRRESMRVARKNSLEDDDGETDHLYRFANRMSWRLGLAMQRINDMKAEIDRLNEKAVENSWANEVDRQGGSLTAEEIARPRDERW